MQGFCGILYCIQTAYLLQWNEMNNLTFISDLQSSLKIGALCFISSSKRFSQNNVFFGDIKLSWWFYYLRSLMKWAKIKIGNAHNMSDTVPGSILLITSKYGQKIKDINMRSFLPPKVYLSEKC